jgi:hypothetical protein
MTHKYPPLITLKINDKSYVITRKEVTYHRINCKNTSHGGSLFSVLFLDIVKKDVTNQQDKIKQKIAIEKITTENHPARLLVFIFL